MSEDGGGKSRGLPVAAGDDSSRPPPPYYYGTSQGVANYQPQHPPPSHSVPQHAPPPGYAVYEEGRLFREERLPCCGLGIGWFLFIIGFLLGAIPWYVGAFLLLCVRLDYRERPGLIACTIAALLAALAVTIGVTKVTHSW